MTRERDDGVHVDDLLASAADDDPSPAQLSRLEARLAPLLGGPPGGGPGQSGPGHSGPGGAGPATPGAAAAGAAAAKLGSGAAAKLLLATALLGGAGAGGYALLRSRAPEPQRLAVPAVPAIPDTAPAPPTAPPPADAAPSPAAAPPDAAPHGTARAPRPGSPEALAAEARLLERAQTALRDGAPAAALRAVEHHRARFRAGALAEERERLAIEALLALGRRADAETRARRFRASYPRSVQWQRIRDLLDAPR